MSCYKKLLALCFCLLVVSFTLLYTNKKNEIIEPSKTTPTLRSADDCENSILLWLDGKNQFRASIYSDVPLYQGVEFSGYYIEGKSFIMLAGLFGDEFTLEKKGDFYMQKDVSEQTAKNMGWKMQRVTPERVHSKQ
jgi:hypothetical protein